MAEWITDVWLLRESITSRVHARVGLLGNPSDGYFGKTIALSLATFWAEVTLTASRSVRMLGHAHHDGLLYTSMEDLTCHLAKNGYGGGLRLLQATCKALVDYCAEHQVKLPTRGFTLSYETNIPRQAGLSGSSAIVCAALNCLIAFFDLGLRIDVAVRPVIVLAAEQLLGITAGLQDRVIQVYGGLMYMDFNEQDMKARGHGRYERLDEKLLPRLWLVYTDNPSDSGGVHSAVRQRWLAGEQEVREGMAQVAACASQGRQALEQQGWESLAKLMDRNFDLRRRMFGDEVLGPVNLRMIELARSVGAAAKFCGSGGAIVVMCPGGATMEDALQTACQREGFTCLLVEVGPNAEPLPADGCQGGGLLRRRRSPPALVVGGLALAVLGIAALWGRNLKSR